MMTSEVAEVEEAEAQVSNDKEWLQRARDAFRSSTTYFDANIRSQIEASMRQTQGLHPQGSKYLSDAYKARSKVFRPKTRAAIRKGEATAAAAYFSTDDVISTAANDDNDPIQLIGSDGMRELLKIRLTRPAPMGIPWFLTLCGAYQEAQTIGVVCSKQEWQYVEEKQIDRPTVELIPVENLRIDPGAKWTNPINTSPYVIHMIPMYVKDVKAQMGKGPNPWRTLTDAEIQSGATRANDSIRQTREGRTDSTDNSTAISDYSIVWVHENIVEVEGEDVVYHTLGTEHILSDPKPLDEVYHHGVRPFVMGIAVIEAHKVYPSSVPTLTKDLQAEINDVANQRLDNVKFVLNKRYFAKRNKQVDLRSLTRNTPGSVTLMSDLDDVKVIETGDVTSSAFAEQDRLNQDYDDVAGGFSGSSVASNRNLNETVGGMAMLSSAGNQITEYQLRTFSETWVEPVLKQLAKLEAVYETDEKILLMAGQRAGLDGPLTDEMLAQEPTITVNVGIGASNPQTQVERFFYGLNTLLRTKPELAAKLKDEEVIKESFGKLGYKDGMRFFNLEEQQNNPAQDALTQAELALKQAQTAKAEAEAMAKKVEVLYSAMQAAQVAAGTPATVPIADEIAKSAGFVDANAAPIYPEPQQASVPVTPQDNTSPMFPPRMEGPGEGMMTGIETPQADGIQEYPA